MLFCPSCGNMLLLISSEASGFKCETCVYYQSVSKPATKKLVLERKTADDILGGPDAWKNVDQMSAACPHCDNKTAYFKQIQVRSADEPMTTFYKCTACGGGWNE